MLYNNYDHAAYIAGNKPKPQFAVGDFVISGKQIATIDRVCHNDHYHLKGQFYHSSNVPGDRIVPWRPAEGEWCWFINNPHQLPRLGKFICMNDEFFESSDGYAFRRCEPFIGKLPTGCE